MKTFQRTSLMTLGLVAGLAVVSWAAPLVGAVAPPEPSGSESILLTPTFKRYSLNDGSTKQDSFNIVNDGQAAFDFVVYARPYTVKNELYEPDFTAATENADAYKWIQFEQPSYTIQPGQTVTVNYTVRVPAGAAPGGHYGVLFAETQPSSAAQGTSIIRKKRVGEIIYANVSGSIRTGGKLESNNVPFFQFTPPLKIRSTISNSGNTDFSVKSSVTVRDVLGNLKYTANKEVTVLPQKPRELSNDWQKPAWIGLYKVEQTNTFLDTTKTSDAYVLLVPLWAYLTLIIVIVGRVLYAMVLRRRKK